MIQRLPDGFLLYHPSAEDIEAILHLINTSQASSLTHQDMSALLHLLDIHLETDVWIVMTPERRITGCAYAHLLEPGLMTFTIAVSPDAHEQGIRAALHQVVEERAYQLGTQRRPLSNVLLSTQVCVENRTEQQFFEQLDYQAMPGEYVRMDIGMKAFHCARAPWTEGIAMRPFVAAQDRSALSEAMVEVWGHPYDEDRATAIGGDPALWFIACERERLVGWCLCAYKADQVGWIWQMAVRPQWRKRGVGTALLNHAFEIFSQLGAHNVRLDVAGSNGEARRLYERAGMNAVRHIHTYEKELSLNIID